MVVYPVKAGNWPAISIGLTRICGYAILMTINNYESLKNLFGSFFELCRELTSNAILNDSEKTCLNHTFPRKG